MGIFSVKAAPTVAPEQKKLSTILGIFTTVKADLSEFTDRTTAELQELEASKLSKSEELATATAALTQIELIVPTPK